MRWQLICCHESYVIIIHRGRVDLEEYIYWDGAGGGGWINWLFGSAQRGTSQCLNNILKGSKLIYTQSLANLVLVGHGHGVYYFVLCYAGRLAKQYSSYSVQLNSGWPNCPIINGTNKGLLSSALLLCSPAIERYGYIRLGFRKEKTCDQAPHNPENDTWWDFKLKVIKDICC